MVVCETNYNILEDRNGQSGIKSLIAFARTWNPICDIFTNFTKTASNPESNNIWGVVQTNSMGISWSVFELEKVWAKSYKYGYMD